MSASEIDGHLGFTFSVGKAIVISDAQSGNCCQNRLPIGNPFAKLCTKICFLWSKCCPSLKTVQTRV